MKNVFLLFLFSIFGCLSASSKIIGYKLTNENGLPDYNIRYIEQDTEGYMYFVSLYAAYQYDGYTFRQLPDTVFHAYSNKYKNSLKDKLKGTIGVDKQGVLVYTDPNTKETIRLKIFPESIFNATVDVKCNVLTDRRGLIWISTNGNGLFVYDKRTKELTHLHKNDATGLLETNNIIFLTEDRNGNIWISFEKYGVTCLSIVPEEYQITHFNAQTEDDRENNARILRRLEDGRIIVGNNTTSLYLSDDELKSMKPIPNIDCSYISASLDSHNRLWLGSKLKGINIGGKMYDSGRVDFILKDRKGRMWTGGLNSTLSLCSFDGKGNFQKREFMKNIKRLTPRTLIEDHKGYLWLGTEKGLFVFHPDSLIINEKQYTLVSNLPTRCVFEDSQKRIWFGTAGKGVLFGTNDHAVPPCDFTQLTNLQGLCNNVIQSIIEDDNGQVVIGTENGCSYYQPNTGNIYNHYITEHPLNNFYNEQCVIKLSDGRLVFGTYHGIVTVNKELTKSALSSQELLLTNLLVNGNSLYNLNDSILPSVNAVNHSGNIQLKHNQNSITAFFSDFNYTPNGHTSYSYKLEGYDADWSEPTISNFVSYRSLPPGDYSLCVRYKGEYSQWWPDIKRIHLTILCPWWKTWWAITLYIIAGFTIGLIVYRQLHTVYVLRQSIKLEKKLTEYKLVFFTNISHEFRTPLTLIQNAMEGLKDKENIPSDLKFPIMNMGKSVDRLLRLVNQLLEFRRMQNNKLNLSLQQTNVVDFLYNIYISFYNLAKTRNIDYKFMTTQKDCSIFIDRSFVDKVAYNLLSNAFKYTPKGGNITLRIDTNDTRYIRFTIEDTGAGISKAKQKELFKRFSTEKLKEGSIGIGLHFIHELVKTHQGDIRFSENPVGGSIFCVELPVDKTIYSENDFIKTDTILQEDFRQDTKKGFASEYKENVLSPMNDKEILVVEDDNDIAEMLRHEFCPYFKVSITNDGQEALEYLQEHPDVSLIIADVVMPRMDGFELLRNLKRDKQLSAIPFIILTALSAPEKQEKGFMEGADAFVPKPFNAKILLAQCYRIIQQRELLKSFSQKDRDDKVVPVVLYREEKEKKFIEQLDSIINKRMEDNMLSVEILAEKFGYSRTKFYNKVKMLTGKTPNEYLKDKRLSQGAELLQNTDLTVSQIAYKIGFTTPQYFATSFKQKYGVTPTDYQNKKTMEYES